MTKPSAANFSFHHLVDSIRDVHSELQAQAGRAVNVSLTLRNWAIGCYIEEYQRHGVDRAAYGDRLIDDLANSLKKQGLKRCSKRELYRYRTFYLTYPQIVESAPPQFRNLLPQSLLQLKESIGESVTPQLTFPSPGIIKKLSFTHLAELIQINDPLKRTFYEVESIQGSWSVRELKRQIASLYYERSGLSKNKKKLSEMVKASAEQTPQQLNVRDPYIFEFLGLKSKEVMGESDLEDALLDKLQEFLLELGHGFCFEARQKRILIGETYNFVDLVFYHRILKCHVLVELKLEGFSHENSGQLNTYLNWHEKNMQTPGDNPPVGILLCTHKDHTLVEYALANLDNNLFVSKYQLELPRKEEMKSFIEEQMKDKFV